MRYPRFFSLALASLCASLAMAQTTSGQGVLSNGNSQLPSCAQSCPLLQQAAQACSGTTTADQAVWICFCQSAYLKGLYTTDTGICSSVCTDASDSQQVSTWYTSNCGTDNGASEHSDTSPTTATTSAPTTTSTSSSSGSSTVSKNNGGSTWWGSHWQWIVMLIVLAIGLTGIALCLRWLKRWRRQRQDRINGGFNSGITTRHAPIARHGVEKNTAQINPPFTSANHSGVIEPISHAGSTNNSARTREAFMPYGYGYTRSESRIGHQTDRLSVISGRGTPGVSEKDVDVTENPVHGSDTPNGRRLASRPLNERGQHRYSAGFSHDTYNVKEEK